MQSTTSQQQNNEKTETRHRYTHIALEIFIHTLVSVVLFLSLLRLSLSSAPSTPCIPIRVSMDSRSSSPTNIHGTSLCCIRWILFPLFSLAKHGVHATNAGMINNIVKLQFNFQYFFHPLVCPLLVMNTRSVLFPSNSLCFDIGYCDASCKRWLATTGRRHRGLSPPRSLAGYTIIIDLAAICNNANAHILMIACNKKMHMTPNG